MRRDCRQPCGERSFSAPPSGSFAQRGIQGSVDGVVGRHDRDQRGRALSPFPLERALYLAALDHSADVLLQRWRRIADEAVSPMAALVELGRWDYLELERDARHIMLRFRFCTERDPEIRERAQAHFRAILSLIDELYGRARDAGEIAADTDTGAHARVFVAIGTLLDVTQVIGLRELLTLESLASMLSLAMPRAPSSVSGGGS